jgi:hypothetical protein
VPKSVGKKVPLKKAGKGKDEDDDFKVDDDFNDLGLDDDFDDDEDDF